MNRAPRPLPLLLLAALLAACAGAGDAPTPLPSTSPAVQLPADPDTLLLQVRSAGGFMAPDFRFADLPWISIYADGRVITEGARPAIYPGALVPSLLVARIGVERVAGLLAAATAAGLASGTDVGYPPHGAADVPDTEFIVWGSQGVTHTSFGALGIGSDPTDPAEAVARTAAIAFRDLLSDPALAANPVPYRPAAVRLAVRPYTATDLAQPQLDWPLAGSLATAGTAIVEGTPQAGRCLIVTGADLERVWPMLGEANMLTPFASEGQRHALVVRPLLPDEPATCD